MAQTEDIIITLAGDVAGLLRETVAAGGYDSPSDAISDAPLLRRAQQDSDFFGYSPGELDRLIGEADASGPSPLTTEEITREGFRRAGVPYPEA